MLFADFAQYLDRLDSINLRNEITRVLAELLNKSDIIEVDKLCYLLEGRVVPLYVNLEFGVSEKLVLRVLPTIFGLKEDQIKKVFHKTGDLGETVYQLKILSHQQATINNQLFETEEISTITDVHKILYEIASQTGMDSQRRKLALLTSLLTSLDAVGAKYAIRIILAKLRLGFSDRTILDSLSWMITGNKTLRPALESIYHVNPDIGRLAKIVKNKNEGYVNNLADKTEPVPGMPVVMALCERASSPEDVWKHIVSKENLNPKAAIEDKYDGLRCQVHKNGREIVVFSRNLENTTAMYPEIVEAVSKLTVKTLIIEGEAVAFDPKTGVSLPFQETVRRKRKYDVLQKSIDVPLKLFVFELLYMDGKSYLKETYEIRRKTLADLLIRAEKPLQNLQLAVAEIVDSPEKLEKIFVDKSGRGMEGVIIKKLNGIYAAGARDFNWIKLKRGFQGQKLTDTIDCVVMGYDLGKGKRTKFGIGGFLVGIYDPEKENYQTLAKIGTGLSDEEWGKMKISASSADKQNLKKPENYNVKKEMECDVWVEPKVVVEIKADEITKSDLHTAANGLSLRFPRLISFREDKDPQETTSVSEILRMFKLQSL